MQTASESTTTTVPISVLIAVKNEANNLDRCLDALVGWGDEIVVVDSQSTDGTAELAAWRGATVIQFHYQGGWPKKRQWALDTFGWRHDWILLLDADELLTPEVKQEIEAAIADPHVDGYWLRFRIYFLGKMLRFGGTELKKLSLFRLGRGRYEKRLENQDASMADMEIHEHVVVDGPARCLKNPVRHENIDALDRYIDKHNAYSNWEAKVFLEGSRGEIEPRLLGTQAERRRWLKKRFLMLPGASALMFLHSYLFKLGLLDGRGGLIYALFRGVQVFHTKAKIHELRLRKRPAASVSLPRATSAPARTAPRRVA
jgi:glycosyltransferase involved in cell wall biosynthesis